MALRSALRVALVFVLGFQLSLVLAKPAVFSQTIKRSLVNTNEYQTNAQRLAAGLTPLPPKRRFAPTKVQLAARTEPSPTAFSGFIQVKDFANPNTVHGWFSRSLWNGRILLAIGNGNRLPVGFTYYSRDRVFEMPISDADPFHFAGVAASNLLHQSASTQNNFIRTNSAAPNAGPQTVGHAAGAGTSESYIWKFDPTTKELTGVFSNTANSEIPVYFYVTNGAGDRFLSLSGHPNLGSAKAVTKVSLYLAA